MENRNGKKDSQIRLVAIVITLSVFVSAITSSIVVKTIVPNLIVSTPVPVLTIATTTFTQSPVTPTPTQTIDPSLFPLAPMRLEMPEIETNLLQNNGFENGLSGWTYSDNLAGISVYEIAGVNGKGFCSRQYLFGASGPGLSAGFLNKEWAGFVQEIPIDPTQTYFFSGWVKLNKATNVYAMAKFYNGSKEVGWGLATKSIGFLSSEGETTNGWTFISGERLKIPSPGTNRVLIGFWHGLINNPQDTVDSTFCVDDLVFGKIIK
jgi:hypothetical protein